MSRDNSIIEQNEMEAAVGTVPELIHAMSHDIGEPVREILGFAKLIASRAPRDVDPHFLDDLEHVTSGALRTRAMLEVLCDYVRIDSSTPQVAMVDLDELATHLAAHALVVADQVTTPVELELALVGVTAGYPHDLRLVLEELILNAARFGVSPDGITRVHVVGSITGDWFECHVGDNGPGIPADATDRALQLFQRLHPRAELDSMGAGLALARRRIEACGGTFSVDPPKPGAGMGITIRLPIPAIDLRDPALPAALGARSPALTIHTTEGDGR